MSREQAYEWVQRNAMRSFHEQRDFKELLLGRSGRHRACCRAAALDEAFDLDAQLRNVDAIFARVFVPERASGESAPSGRLADGREDESAMKARVFVTLKPSVFDPQGSTIADALQSLGYGAVADVRQGKYFELDIDAPTRADAEQLAAEVADRVLANPVIESFRIELRTPRPRGRSRHDVRGRRVSRDPTATTTPTTPPSTCSARQARFVWHKDTSLGGADVVILPGGFSHGDYLRTGAIARFSPVMGAVQAFAAAGGPVLGICNGFQILLECGLLPGAMLRNRDLKFHCEFVGVRVERTDTPFTQPVRGGPGAAAAHRARRGQLLCAARRAGRARSAAARRVPLRGRGRRGDRRGQSERLARTTSPASATSARNVVGLMPHPERAVRGGASAAATAWCCSSRSCAAWPIAGRCSAGRCDPRDRTQGDVD